MKPPKLIKPVKQPQPAVGAGRESKPEEPDLQLEELLILKTRDGAPLVLHFDAIEHISGGRSGGAVKDFDICFIRTNSGEAIPAALPWMDAVKLWARWIAISGGPEPFHDEAEEPESHDDGGL